MAQPLLDDQQGLFEGRDEVGGHRSRRHARDEQLKTFFDVESRSSLSSVSRARSRLTLTDALTITTTSTGTNFNLVDPSPATFLFSSSTSTATATTGAAAAAVSASTSTGSAQYHSWLQPQTLRQRRLQLQLHPPELDLLEPDEWEDEIDDDGSSNEDCSDIHSALFGDYSYGHGYYLSSPRPSSSRSHLHHQTFAYAHEHEHEHDGIDATSDTTSPSIRGPPDGRLLPSMPNMTREEFETLPPTIQRKYFSTLERLRFAQHSSFAQYHNSATLAATDEPLEQPSTAPRRQTSRRPRYRSKFHTDSAVVKPSSKPRVVNATEQHFYTNLPDKIKRRHLSAEEQLVAHRRQQSIILDAADEALLKLGKPKSQQHLASPAPAESPSPDHYFADMPCTQDDQTPRAMEPKTAANSLYDSFRWLEEEDDLDLRLFLDDYHINLRDEMPRPSKTRHPSFRRHLSISKLPFGRSSVSFNNIHNSRPGTKDTVTSPMSTARFPASLPASPGHGRKASRALSLISPNKQSPDPSGAFDPAAAHYQDPEARAKLRVYLGSPQKFDEAIEFGFPSLEEEGRGSRTLKRAESRQGFLGEWDHELCTFLEDDDKSSILSDDVTATEPDSPKTPEMLEKPLSLRPVRLSSEPVVTRGDYAQASATSREMTLRMTLTRPDLRADEDNIYGWQKKPVRKSVMREGAVSPLLFTREISNPKESIERQFAMMDQENVGHENGVVKRFWNRVRRS